MSRVEARCCAGFVILAALLLVVMFSTAGAADPFTMKFPTSRDTIVTTTRTEGSNPPLWPLDDQGFPVYSDDPVYADRLEFASGGGAPAVRAKKGAAQTMIMDWDTDAINTWLGENTGAGDEISWTLNVYPLEGPPQDVAVQTLESLNDWAEGDQPGNFTLGQFEWSQGTAAATESFAQARYIVGDDNATRTLDVENSLPWVENDFVEHGRDGNQFPILQAGWNATLARGAQVPDFVNSSPYVAFDLTIAAALGTSASLDLDSEFIDAILSDPVNRGIVFGPTSDADGVEPWDQDNNETSNWLVWTREGSGGVDDDGNPMPVPPEEYPGPMAPFLEVTVTPGERFLGDMNVNGLVDFDDIAPFNLGLTNEAEYETLYGQLPVVNGDTDLNGIFDFDDIVGFVALLGGGQAVGVVVPEPSTAGLLMGMVLAGGTVGLGRRRRTV